MAVLVVAAVVGAGARQSTVWDLMVGDCFTLPMNEWDGVLTSVDVLDCEAALERVASPGSVLVAARVESTPLINEDRSGPFPGIDRVATMAAESCDEATDTAILASAPDEGNWSLGGRVLCLRLGR